MSDMMVVEQCTCGSVHVTIGAVTLRLASTSISSLAATLDEAARSIVGHAAPLTMTAKALA